MKILFIMFTFFILLFASDSTAQTATGSKQSEANAQLESKGVSENTPVQTTPYQPEKGDPNF